MLKKKNSGIVDIPLSSKEDDKLNIMSYENALREFIKNTESPITIALQGEWGSGKTSLMNRMEEQLCEALDARMYGIWLNTWHYALIKDRNEILPEIIQALISDIIKISENEHPEKLKKLISEVYNVGKKVLTGISKAAVKTAVSQISEDAADDVSNSIFNGDENKHFNLSDLKTKLSTLINKTIEKNKEKGISKDTFIFFIDDLDRVDPALAVNILELMKNIFDIDNCIFVLAIDYDVVVKGLKSKFGELTDKNEREFRSFFDKIIQLPFRMPLNAYVIDDFIKEMLLSVNIISKEEAENTQFIKSIASFTTLSIGTNPRSIKRLINTLSFVNLLIKSQNNLQKTEHEICTYEKQLIYSVICLQTGFPGVYNLLADNSEIESWNFDFATKHKIPYREEKYYKHNFSNNWQEILYAYCNKSPFLKKHFNNIVSIIKNMQEIADENKKSLSEILPEIIENLSVTNVKSISKPQIEINNIRVLFALNQKLAPVLESKIVSPLKFVERKGRMIAKLSYKFDEQKNNNWISIFVYVKQNNIYLKLGCDTELFYSERNSDNPFKNMEMWGTTELFNQFSAEFEDLSTKYAEFNFSNKPKNGLSVKDKKQFLNQYFHTTTENAEYLYTSKFINNLGDFIIDFMKIIYKINKADWRAK